MQQEDKSLEIHKFDLANQDRFAAIVLDRYASEVFYHPIKSLNRVGVLFAFLPLTRLKTTTTQQKPTPSPHQKTSDDYRFWLLTEPFSISGEIRQDNAKQRSVVQCWENSLEHYTECRTEPHDALQHVTRGVMSVITQ